LEKAMVSDNNHRKSIEALAFLDVDKHVRKAAGKCEENVKIKIG